jgi:hypothetical protein
MGLPGTYIELTTPAGEKYRVPYSTKFGFQCQQIWFKPLEELFGYLKNLAGTVPLVGKYAEAGIDVVTGIGDILGKKFMNMAFQAQAWKGEEPVSINIQLPFFMGMNDIWNAKKEVYEPIMSIMRESVPQSSSEDIFINAPGPTGLDVYKAYSDQLFTYISEIPDIVSQRFTNVVQGTTNEKKADPKESLNLMQAKTWSFAIGYSVDGTKINHAYMKLKNLIVRNSGFNFSTELDDNNAPINGEVSLSMSAQTIIVSTDFNDMLKPSLIAEEA